MTLLANIGIPMLFPQVVLMGIAFLPVVFIEGILVRFTLGFPFLKAMKGVALANVLTTLVGVPVAWFAMVLLGVVTTGGYALGLESPATMLAAVTLQAAWLIPYEEHLFWMIPCAATFLLIPSFICSVFIERFALALKWADTDRRAVYSAVLRANVWSYLFLLVVGGILIATSVR